VKAEFMMEEQYALKRSLRVVKRVEEMKDEEDKEENGEMIVWNNLIGDRSILLFIKNDSLTIND
jgi:hypothetical protein